MYERSALQSANIYTKAFIDATEWTRAQKLVNHLDPRIFWGDRSQCDGGPLPSEHKGGVQYDYWTANPWAIQRASDSKRASGKAVASAPLASLHDPLVEHSFFDDSCIHAADLSEDENSDTDPISADASQGDAF